MESAKLRDFPVDALPPVLREMAIAVACTISTDIAMPSTAILSSVSYCFSGVYRMSGKRDHTEPIVLDTLIIAEPSAKKSPVISLIKQIYKLSTFLAQSTLVHVLSLMSIVLKIHRL